MTPSEAAELLTIASAYDGREVETGAAQAWSLVLDGLPIADCREAILKHYRSSRFRLMPSDVVERVGELRRDRRMRYGPIPDPALDTDSPTYDRDWDLYQRRTLKAISDGRLLPGETPEGAASPPIQRPLRQRGPWDEL